MHQHYYTSRTVHSSHRTINHNIKLRTTLKCSTWGKLEWGEQVLVVTDHLRVPNAQMCCHQPRGPLTGPLTAPRVPSLPPRVHVTPPLSPVFLLLPAPLGPGLCSHCSHSLAPRLTEPAGWAGHCRAQY